ncbi:MAG TPA: hypothetical protein VF041_14750 [Gemmatimonadaceae bacterium]
MSYDHLVFRRSTAAGPTTGGAEDDLASLGTTDVVGAMLRGAARVVEAARPLPEGEPEWSAESLTGLGAYVISPWVGDDGDVRMLVLRGAWREDAIHLARSLRVTAFDPQCGQDVYPYRLQTLRITPPPDKPLTIRHHRGSAVVTESPLTGDDERFHALIRWCQAHQERWHPAQMSYTSFQPEVEVSAGISGLRLAGTRAMVHGWSSCGPFEREIDPASYEFLLAREQM